MRNKLRKWLAAFLVAVRRSREKVFGIFRRKPAEPAADATESKNG